MRLINGAQEPKGNTSMLEIIIQLVAGAIGGNAAGAALKDKSLGTMGNTLAGVIGGGLGGQILGMMGGAGMADAAEMDIGSIVSSLASGGAGGGVLMVVVGIVKGMMKK